ncbi:MAG TPA: hypothetical protein VH374_26285 [Polyangia bacterium]|jgi:hypothetical protein|nr:hypothetical protein [Polyangia bacterium]
MAYAQRGALGATPSSTAPDFPSMIEALGLQWTPDVFGFTSWDDALAYVQSTGGIMQSQGFGTLYLSPGGDDLAGVVAMYDLWRAFQQLTGGYLPSSAAVLASLGVTGTWQAPGPRPPSVPVTDAEWRRYAGAVLSWVDQVGQVFAAAEPSAVPPVAAPPSSLSPLDQAIALWDSESLKSGLVLPPDDGTNALPTAVSGVATSSTRYVIPTAAIVEGPTNLPDGTWYVVYESDPRNGPNYPALTVRQQPGPTYVEAQAADVSTRMDSCVPLVPGTGAWYWFTAITGSNPANPCTGVPLGWSQGFGLVGPLARQALAASYVAAGMSAPGPVGPVDYGDVVPVVAAPPAPVSHMLAPPPNGGVVVQDQDGNIIPSTPDTQFNQDGGGSSSPYVPPAVVVTQTPPPVEVGTLSTNTVPAVVSAAPGFSTTDLVLAGVVAVLGLALASSGSRR